MDKATQKGLWAFGAGLMHATRSELTLHALEQRLRMPDALLQRRFDAQTDLERERLGRRFDAMWEARAVCDEVLALPECVCGKRSHPSEESAQRHLQALAVLRPQQRVTRGLYPSAKLKRPLRSYRCWYTRAGAVWHVGHLVVQQ